MSPDARRVKPIRDVRNWPVVQWLLTLPPAWQMRLAAALVLVAIAGLYQLCGVSDKLKPLPMPTAEGTPAPSVTPLTTPPVTATPTASTTPAATATPTAVPELTVGGQAIVGDTGGDKLRLRSGAGTMTQMLAILDDGTPLTLLEGPESLDDYEWWKVELTDGQVGWVAGNWLLPVAP